MFDWFKKPNYTNVVKFPAPTPYIEPLAVKPPEKDPVVFYSVGPTDNNRISFQMGYSSITMTKLGVENLIAQLQVAADQLKDEDKTE
jgi:hypothetical protein